MTMLTKLFGYLKLMTPEFATGGNLFPAYSLVGNSLYSSLCIHSLPRFISRE